VGGVQTGIAASQQTLQKRRASLTLYYRPDVFHLLSVLSWSFDKFCIVGRTHFSDPTNKALLVSDHDGTYLR
jgi:hypothetical protein